MNKYLNRICEFNHTNHKMLIQVIGVAILLIRGCTGVTVVLRPQDTAREVGKNVTLACVVTGKQVTESVQWKHKPSGSDAFNALTFNANVLSKPSKYSIQWTYNLTISNLQAADSGLYRCSTGGNDYDAILTVVDLPKNVSISWSGEPINGEHVNLTCTAQDGLPAPEIRWLINGVDMTGSAVTENSTAGAPHTGYSDVTSYLPLSLDASMNGRGAECIISYRGWDNALKAVYTIQTKYPGGYSNTGGFSNPDTVIFGQPGSSYNANSTSLFEGGMAGKPGMFLLRFLKETAGEKIDVELQQYSP